MLEVFHLISLPIWALYFGVLITFSFIVCLSAVLLSQNRLKSTTSSDGTKLSVPYKSTPEDTLDNDFQTNPSSIEQILSSHHMTGKSCEHKVGMATPNQKNSGQKVTNASSIKRNKSCNKFQSLLDKLMQENPQLLEKGLPLNVPVTYVGRTESPNEIIPGKLYLGSIYAAQSPAILKKLGITHILSVCDEHLKVDTQQFVHKVICVDDKSSVDLLTRFEEAHNFIDQGVTLVHCLAGISRSATVTISYLMNKLDKTALEATELVHTARTCIKPNAGFVQQLDKYEKILQTKRLAIAC